jgi:hypothetical protein
MMIWNAGRETDMPNVRLIAFECDRHLPPCVCASCGEPVDHEFRFTLPSTRLQLLLVLLPLLCPPAFLIVLLVDPGRRVQVPMCKTDQAVYRQRARAVIASYVVFVVGSYLAAVSLLVLQPFDLDSEPFVFVVLTGYALAAMAWSVPVSLLATRWVRVPWAMGRKIILAGVHPLFAQALKHGRASDPNPDRRVMYGDLRDDFDEDLNWFQSVRNDPIK